MPFIVYTCSMLRALFVAGLLFWAAPLAAQDFSILQDVPPAATRPSSYRNFNRPWLVQTPSTTPLTHGDLYVQASARLQNYNIGEDAFRQFVSTSTIPDFLLYAGYGITPQFGLGIEFSGYQQRAVLEARYALGQQGKGIWPLSVGFVARAGYLFQASDSTAPNFVYPNGLSRSSAYAALLLSYRISQGFSVQLAPQVLYQPEPRLVDDERFVGAIGMSLKLQLTRHAALLVDYTQTLSPSRLKANEREPGYFPPVGLGTEFIIGPYQVHVHVRNSLLQPEDYLRLNPANVLGEFTFQLGLSYVFPLGGR